MLDSIPKGDSVPLADAVTLAAPGTVPMKSETGPGNHSSAATGDARTERSHETGALPTDATSKVQTEPAPLWLRRADQVIVTTLLVMLIGLLSVHWLRLSRWGAAEIEVVSQQPRELSYSLDINAASWVEWAQLDGIGEKLAKRIVADRDKHGPFRDASDVGRVTGIHARQLESMKPFLRGGSAIEVAQP